MSATTNLSHDDPRLTAYALNELSPSEREQVEAMLRDDASARLAIEEIRATANLLSAELQQTNGDAGLTSEQREAINARLARPRQSVRSRWIVGVASGLAAAAIAAAIGLPAMSKARYRSNKVASSLRQAGQAQLLYSNDNKDYYSRTLPGGTVAPNNTPASPPLAAGRQYGFATNHDEDKQNLFYADGHVSFEKNPFTGVQRDGKINSGLRLNNSDASDSLLLPSEDAPDNRGLVQRGNFNTE